MTLYGVSQRTWRVTWFKGEEQEQYHSFGTPAVTTYADASPEQVICEEWYYEGARHRSDFCGPAYIEWDPNTRVVVRERYYENGKLNNTCGPAWIDRDAHTGEVTGQYYYVQGVRLEVVGPEGPCPLDLPHPAP